MMPDRRRKSDQWGWTLVRIGLPALVVLMGLAAAWGAAMVQIDTLSDRITAHSDRLDGLDESLQTSVRDIRDKLGRITEDVAYIRGQITITGGQ